MFERGAEPVDAHICAAAADKRVPLCSGLLSALDRVDVQALDAPAAVDAAVGFDRLINRAHALRLQSVATTVRRYQRFEKVDPERSAAAELGAALGLGSRGADAEVTYAWELTSRLRRTWQRMHDGAVAYGKARLLVDETLDLTTEQAQAVEDRVLDKAGERTFAQHAAAVRRAVVAVDPTAPERRRRAADRAARLVRRYAADGLADLVVTLPVAQVDAAYTAADAWARARKAGGDERSLDALRAEAFVRWATSYLMHGDSTTCDLSCDPVADEPGSGPSPDAAAGEASSPGDEPNEPSSPDAESNQPSPPDAESNQPSPGDDDLPTRNAPVRHGRKLAVGLVWGLSALLRLDDSPGALLDSGEVVGADHLRELLAAGARLRRMLIDPSTGELVDVTPGSWSLCPDLPRSSSPGPSALPAHGQPYWVGVVVDTDTWMAWSQGRLAGPLAAAIAAAPQAVRDLLAAPRTDATLDGRPGAEAPSAALAEFVALRDRHPTNPTAAPTAAGAGDVDHVVPRAAGGPTIRANLHSPTRRWHLLRTVGGWQLRIDPAGGYVWVSPHGRRYRIDPYDYRQGP
ncbi:MAG TPA: DUF222 domain-containing protein [Mycobacteriales bacterium]|nr:DUF222 domain-containing protein [Mycobacteriales bacterium]